MSKIMRALVLAAALVAIPTQSFAGLLISINIAPPALPVYVQPVCPAPGYIWTPGYWAYDADGGYYWVPGTWVLAPEPGLLWTPGYWGWSGGVFAWNAGYWGPHVGFYGGVNYGFGYGGVGFVGGRWDGGVFHYNTAVNNVNTTIIHNTYNQTVVNNVTVNHVSYNGGTGGVRAEPTAEERSYAGERHVDPTPEQVQHRETAAADKASFASVNHGKPSIAATARPGEFKGAGVVAATKGAHLTPSQTHAPAGHAASPGGTGGHGAAVAGHVSKSPTTQTGHQAQPLTHHATPKPAAPKAETSKPAVHAPAAPKPAAPKPQVHAPAPKPQVQHAAAPKAPAQHAAPPAPKPQAQHAPAPASHPAPAPHPQVSKNPPPPPPKKK
jgi:hypothetical protein